MKDAYQLQDYNQDKSEFYPSQRAREIKQYKDSKQSLSVTVENESAENIHVTTESSDSNEEDQNLKISTRPDFNQSEFSPLPKLKSKSTEERGTEEKKDHRVEEDPKIIFQEKDQESKIKFQQQKRQSQSVAVKAFS